jgi:hypothetical protein
MNDYQIALLLVLFFTFLGIFAPWFMIMVF